MVFAVINAPSKKNAKARTAAVILKSTLCEFFESLLKRNASAMPNIISAAAAASLPAITGVRSALKEYATSK